MEATPHKCITCDSPAIKCVAGSWLCAKHKRLRQMRYKAMYDGKVAPSLAEMENLPGANLCCPDCGVTMTWTSAIGRRTLATFQHYRDGALAIVCQSCNSRHGRLPGDMYRDLADKSLQHCPSCRRVLPPAAFHKHAGRGRGIQVPCKECRSHRDRSRTARDLRAASLEA